jgi:holo-[acyl-carrier protein] synthase
MDDHDILADDLNTALETVRVRLDNLHLLGMGIDVTDVAWAERILTRYPKQLDKIFNQAALDYSLGKRQPAQYLAARMALKEAVVKALGTGLAPGMTWRDIELLRTRSGKPELALHGKVLERADALGVVRWELSIAHRGDYAVAIAAAVGKPSGPNREHLDARLVEIRHVRAQALVTLAALTEETLAYPTDIARWDDVRRVLLRFGDHMREHANQIDAVRVDAGRAPTVPQRILAEAEAAWGRLLASTVGLTDDDLHTKPSEEAQSIAEVLEQVLRSEQAYLRAIRAALYMAARRAEE